MRAGAAAPLGQSTPRLAETPVTGGFTPGQASVAPRLEAQSPVLRRRLMAVFFTPDALERAAARLMG